MKLQEMIKKIFLLCLAVIFLSSCSKGDSTSASDGNVSPDKPGGYLVEGISLGEVSVSNIRLAAQEAGFPAQMGEYLKYSIKAYKIIYRTTYKGQSILASGLITYPTGIPDSMPTMIVGNIQTYADKYAPSEFAWSNFSSSFAAVAAALGSFGYFALIPDMIGYGESKGFIFPMQNYEYSANTVIDFIHASDEFIKAKKLQVNGKKFLAGYSEGGYIAMATLKMIEEKPDTGIKIDATAVGAGGYNLVNILNKIIINGDGTYSAPSHLVSLLYSYNSIYDWGHPLSDFFQEPYASIIPTLLSGEYEREEVDQQLTTSLDKLLNPVFLDNLRNNNEPDLINALKENSVDDWAPKSPLMLFHNTNDEKIPYSDSVETYNKMLSNGSQSVFFRDSNEPGSHVDSGKEFMLIATIWFEGMNQ